MKLIDISLTISEALDTWPGDPPIRMEKISAIADGDQVNVTQISFPVHVGTHVDAPAHFLEGGKTADQVPLEHMVGPATVVELDIQGDITRQDLEQASIPPHSKRLLFKTANSAIWARGEFSFQEKFSGLDHGAARYLVERGVEVVGVDYLSVAPFDAPVPTHRTLLEAGVLIIEGLDLSEAAAGDYSLLCLPLKIKGADGAPARVLLMR